MEMIKKPKRVIIADKSKIYPDALQKLIRQQNNVELINVCKTEEELVLMLKTLGINYLIVDE